MCNFDICAINSKHNILLKILSTVQPAMMREKNDNVEDGADEKMLGVDEKEQLARKDEVKFIASDRSNGDAKIDIGSIEKVSMHRTSIF